MPRLAAARLRSQNRTCAIHAYGSHLDGEALCRPGVKDARFGKPVVGDLLYTVPCRAIFLTAPPQRPPP